MKHIKNKLVININLGILVLVMLGASVVIQAEDTPVFSGSKTGGIILRDDVSDQEYRQIMDGQGKSLSRFNNRNEVNPRIYQDDYRPVAGSKTEKKETEESEEKTKSGTSRATFKSNRSTTSLRGMARDVRRKSDSQDAKASPRKRLSFQGLAKQVRRSKAQEASNDNSNKESRYSRIRKQIQK